MRPPHFGFFAALVCVAGPVRAASFDDRVEALFRPPLAEMAAISPDGQRVAYTTQVGSQLRIAIMDLENPGPKRTVNVELERDAALTEEKPPVQLRFLRWATNDRLVFAPTERIVPLPPLTDKNGRAMPNPDGPTVISPIMVAEADGRHPGTLVDARDFLETPENARMTLGDFLRTPKELAAARRAPIGWRMPHLDILGFVPGDREQLIVETRGGHNLPAQHSIDVRTGNVRMFGGNWPSPPGERQIFDWFRLKIVGERQDAVRPTTAWRDGELGGVQQELEVKFPRRTVEILDWSETRARVLFRVTGGSDPGRIFVWQRPENLVVEILRRTPWLNAAKLHTTQFFEFDATDGTRLSGYMTSPRKPRLNPPPLLVVFPIGFPGRAQPAFDPEAQCFADLGFLVARLNHRSVAGVKGTDLTALRGAVDRVSVEDARVALDWLAARFPFDRKRVATLGRGFGGYLAVRALQLQPTVFRCGMAVDAPMDLRPWLRPPATAGVAPAAKTAREIPAGLVDHEGADWKTLSVLDQTEALVNPVLLLVEPGRSPAIDVATGELRAKLQGLGRAADHLELEPGFAAAQPKSRAAVYRKIDEFLNQRLYDYAVKIGPVKEVE